MTESKADIVIIGGGLTGLTLAYLLRNEGIDIHIIEARDRLGGRIHTMRNNSAPPIEMGATWLGRKHTALVALLKELHIGVFEQALGDRAIYEAISTSPPQLVQLPPNDEPSYRIQNGTDSLIQRLAKEIPNKWIHLNEKAQSITDHENQIEVQTNTRKIIASKVVSTLPPYLLQNTINILPDIPESGVSIMNGTHTWMGESIKMALNYTTPFWRAEDLSGTIFSNVGPIPEMYDNSNYEDTSFALNGFLNGAYYSISRKERLELVLQQLRKYYGDKADAFISYQETVWRNEPFTFAPYASHILPHQNNGHSMYLDPLMNGKLYVAGSETAQQNPGYMEGAVRSAKFVEECILNYGTY